eukprot:scaffold25170_cov27-Tisochrysis_lutea.AAC.1
MERRLVPSLSGSKFGPIDHSYNPVSPASRQNKKQACEMRAFPKYHAAEKDSVAGTKSKANVIHLGKYAVEASLQHCNWRFRTRACCKVWREFRAKQSAHNTTIQTPSGSAPRAALHRTRLAPIVHQLLTIPSIFASLSEPQTTSKAQPQYNRTTGALSAPCGPARAAQSGGSGGWSSQPMAPPASRPRSPR